MYNNIILISILKVNKEILQKRRGAKIAEKQPNAFFPCFLYSPTSFILHFRRIRNLSKVNIFAGWCTFISEINKSGIPSSWRLKTKSISSHNIPENQRLNSIYQSGSLVRLSAKFAVTHIWLTGAIFRGKITVSLQ